MGATSKRIERVNKRRESSRASWAQRISLPVLVSSLLLIAYGCVVVWSASLTIADASFPRHLLGVALGLGLAVGMWRLDFRGLANMSTTLLIIDLIVIFLPYVPGLSHNAKGLTGWVKIPLIGLTFQPVELAKLITAFFMASLAAQFNGKIDSIRDYIRLCLMLAVPFGAVIVAGDLGSGLVIFAGGAVIICMSGPRREWVLSTVALLVGLVSLLLAADSLLDSLLGHDVLIKQYQMNRLLVFLNPDADTTGAGYNLLQSLIAVGSGGFFGKGIGNTSQAGRGFLPEAHTDFIFALLSETFGFVGAALLLILFALLLFSTIRVIHRSDSLFLKFVGAGIIGMWTFQIFENIGMCMGLMPITGIPLPFISFGSSSMMMQCATVGIVQSIWRYRSKPA
ncbi:FtsW/RodA/SpoVE family cell cycle protein [Collinsella sp. AGMB00827]|uniref:Probable peptidoglycan glycosyltransferase FtsW n=1 Tax=Collinsella ureilytica TaxID=2869515 RepID=A0ABS7MLW7_9ACTN|nr:FtsW/RodA/SpoVE family cell cycle protein [Collinsella urealyticum]MBY4798066.1 FtsW/RodA/SpoVE family cell cycle protein [Collinsella urealyticum]